MTVEIRVLTRTHPLSMAWHFRAEACKAGARVFVHEVVEQVFIYLSEAKFEHTNDGNTMASKTNASGCNCSLKR
ncbi:conserved protein of unknown function [Ectopseudomonas oleovorans]|uniref:Uncharacterized protein n=1 Tax=Ectopseudomonas oleovorans TaxID=301 RepID=A0A653B3T4_ECTOL|nr:conserved protein of unknown function [Pseudomonas oleovorans]